MNDAYEPMPVEIMRGLRDLWCTLGGLSNHDKTCIIVPTEHLREWRKMIEAAINHVESKAFIDLVMRSESKIACPRVHDGGTDPWVLIEERRQALGAACHALQCMTAVKCERKDFSDRWDQERAVAQYQRRIASLRVMIVDLERELRELVEARIDYFNARSPLYRTGKLR